MNTTIKSLGPCEFETPLQKSGHVPTFTSDHSKVLFDDSYEAVQSAIATGQDPSSFELAGPRERIFFDPPKTTAAIVTCGGLCPGINDIIRSLVMQLYYRYNVNKIYGFRFGYEGLIPHCGHEPLTLRPDAMSNIHRFGGSILGVSRGPQNISHMVDTLEEMEIDILFVIGGDGTLRGAAELAREVERRGLKKAIVGIPKTIDNDIMFLDKSFGFETAFAEAVEAVACAHTEALGSHNGIGIVKLMGRDSGFIACHASLANNDVNYVLIPEVSFKLEGEDGLFRSLQRRLARRKHAVIVVAEGAGQDLLNAGSSTDASGNRKLGDIGVFLKEEIAKHFREEKMAVTIKYIDPSYTIRSVSASPQDNVYCSILAKHAVHAAMAGKTGMLIGRWHGTYVHLPFELVTKGRQKVDPNGELWRSVLESTGQPTVIG